MFNNTAFAKYNYHQYVQLYGSYIDGHTFFVLVPESNFNQLDNYYPDNCVTAFCQDTIAVPC